jgi:hypothetical protein
VKKHSTIKLMTTALIVCLLFSVASIASAHSGRTDARGGHNCSDKSINKGLCTGYHYHNGGSSGSSSSSSSSSSKSSGSSSSASSSKSSTSKQTKDAVKTSDIALIVNGDSITLSNKPLVKNNSTYFPVREVAKAIEASLSFNDAQTELTLKRGEKTVTFKLSSKDIISQNNTTYAPVRAIVEKLGGKVTFDAKSNVIKVDIK